jgi:hypothetical protein
MVQHQPIAFAVWDPASNKWVVTETRKVMPITTPSVLPPGMFICVGLYSFGELT